MNSFDGLGDLDDYLKSKYLVSKKDLNKGEHLRTRILFCRSSRNFADREMLKILEQYRLVELKQENRRPKRASRVRTIPPI